MSEKSPIHNNFAEAGNGLYLPAGLEKVVNPQESALNGAMRIGMEEKGLGSVRYAEEDHLTEITAEQEAKAKEKVVAQILDPRNVIDLKAAIDHKIGIVNDEESHLGNTKDGSKQLREAKAVKDVRTNFIEDYLHIGDPENKREISQDTREKLDALLAKSYDELEKLGQERDKKKSSSEAVVKNNEDEQPLFLPEPIVQDPKVRNVPRPAPVRQPVVRPIPKDEGSNGGNKAPTNTQPVVALPPVHEPQAAEKQEARKKTGRRKILGAAMAGLALVGGFLASGSQKEDKGLDLDIGNHGKDNHENVKVDEADDAFRAANVSEAQRENISDNFQNAEAFFKAISTKKGVEKFEKLNAKFEKEVAATMKSHHMDRRSAEALVKAEMDLYFAQTAKK